MLQIRGWEREFRPREDPAPFGDGVSLLRVAVVVVVRGSRTWPARATCNRLTPSAASGPEASSCRSRAMILQSSFGYPSVLQR